MRLTVVLRKHHLGRLIRTTWQIQRERKIPKTSAENILTQMGIKIQDPLDVIAPKKPVEKITAEYLFKRIVFDKTHPDWNNRTCLTYKDHNVLQEGIPQAQVLIKTIKIADELPEHIKSLGAHVPDDIHRLTKRVIYTSNIFDAHQELLPKRKDPERPAWNFPRDYGLTDVRKVYNLSNKLLHLCECLCSPEITQKRFVIHNGQTSILMQKQSDLLQFALTFDMAILSTLPLQPIEEQDAKIELDLPDLSPLHHTISLEKTNFYKNEDLCPLMSPWSNIHTIFISHNAEQVKNLSELPVTEDQIHARSMLKSFAAAVTSARHKYGANVKNLPKPVTVQCIQSNGKNFHFSIFQLNTLDIDNAEGIKNFWWSEPTMQLFEQAQYQNGKPILTNYNPEVIKNLLALYKNI